MLFTSIVSLSLIKPIALVERRLIGLPDLTLHIEIYMLLGTCDAYGILVDEQKQIMQEYDPIKIVSMYVHTYTYTCAHIQKFCLYKHLCFIHVFMYIFSHMHTHVHNVWKNIIQNVNSSYL